MEPGLVGVDLVRRMMCSKQGLLSRVQPYLSLARPPHIRVPAWELLSSCKHPPPLSLSPSQTSYFSAHVTRRPICRRYASHLARPPVPEAQARTARACPTAKHGSTPSINTAARQSCALLWRRQPPECSCRPAARNDSDRYFGHTNVPALTK